MIEKSPIGFNEAVDTLTGYEEQSIDRRFGGDIETLLNTKPTTAGRALAYIMVKRDLQEQDVKDADGKAYAHVMGLSLRQLGEFFPDEVEEVDEEQPTTAAGEGDTSAD